MLYLKKEKCENQTKDFHSIVDQTLTLFEGTQ